MSGIIENVTATAPDGTTQTVGKLDCSTEFAVLTLENKSADSYILSGHIRSEGNGSFYVEGVKTLPTSPMWQSFSIVVPANVSQLKITFENDVYYIYKWLFEQGNKQTDWAPSPDDYSTTEQMNSLIKQAVDSLALAVGQTFTTRTEFGQEVNKLQSSIELTAGQIESKVSKNEIISTINQSPEAITIAANKINFNGVVTANETFKILEDGSMEATGGTIGGWKIGEEDISSVFGVTGEYFTTVSLKSPKTSNSYVMQILTEYYSGTGAASMKLEFQIDAQGNAVMGDVRAGNITAKNFERGTLEVVVENATVYVTKEIPLSFTPTETTQCVLTLRTSGSPQPRYLNCWANYYQPNAETTPLLQACLTAGGSSASTVPAGTYYIDYIAANV